ncbi:MAG: rhodanese-like domain-containing protein [Cyclobacteriaceae bacterium]|nr:rhodanese-like domain-containing protein [Cyclobacteriaceae bacterium]
MFDYLKNLFGIGKRKELLVDAIRRGAYIIDVRTPQEYKMGHIQQAVNIPLDQIRKNSAKIRKMDKPVITCCQTGSRSGRARSILRKQGIPEVINGRGWISLRELIKKA